MTYRIVSDHEVALQMKIDVQGKALQKSMNEVNELRKQLAERDEFIEASRKQERVGIVKQKRYANGTFVLWNKCPSAEMELFAAPVIAPDVLKDAERYRWLREQSWQNNLCVVDSPKNSVKLGSFCPSQGRLDSLIDAAMGGAA